MPFRSPETFGTFAENAETQEEGLIRQIERSNPEVFRKLTEVGKQLRRAFADNGQELIQADGWTVDNDVPMWRIDDLNAALGNIESFKEQFPKRYQANIPPILEDPDRVRRVLEEYGAWVPGTQFEPGAKAVQLQTLAKLRRIDASRFPRE